MRWTLLLLLWLPACAHYDAIGVAALAAQYGDAPTVTSGECEAIAQAGSRLREGPDTALYGVGRAGDLARLANGADAQASHCREVVSRGWTGEKDRRAAVGFSVWWARVVEAVQ